MRAKFCATAMCAAVLLLAGCGQGGSANGGAAGDGAAAPATSGASAAFPDLFGASYRVEGVMHRPDGTDMRMVQIHAGKKSRMEMTEPTSGMQSISIMDMDARQAFTLTNVGGRQMAMRMSLDQAQANAPTPNANFDPHSVTRVGPCSAAGENGTEWSHAFDNHTMSMCLTSDGIILKQSRDGTLYWETTSIQRGPQDPALFSLPAGVQVMDMSAMTGQMSGAMAGRLQQMREKAGQ